jgi:hypothetical protein
MTARNIRAIVRFRFDYFFFAPAFCFAHRAFCAIEIAFRAFADIFRRFLGAATAAERLRVPPDALPHGNGFSPDHDPRADVTALLILP